jgi:hypothetical protein
MSYGDRFRAVSGGLFIAVLFQISACVGIAQAAEPATSFSLSEGHIGRYWWGSQVEAPGEGVDLGYRAICLSITLLEPTSRYSAEGSESAECGPLAADEPMIQIMAGGKKGKRRTVATMLFDGEVEKLYLKLRNQPAKTVRLKKITQEELGAIWTGPLSYYSSGYAGRFCIQRFVAYGASGSVVSKSGRQSCA